MVKNRHSANRLIAEVDFAAPTDTVASVEVLSLAELRVRGSGGALTAPRRPTFHHLLTVQRGHLWHTVDFTGHVLEPGTWLWIRPGQVHQWHDLTTAEGTLILFEAEVLDPTTAQIAALNSTHAPVVHTPTGDSRVATNLALKHLQTEFQLARRASTPLHVAILGHLLAALVLRLTDTSHAVGTPAGEHPATFLKFRDAVDAHFDRTRRVNDYADMLGYSPRTLSRATMAAAGVGAKEFIDRRVLLESKRLLAHGDQSAAQISSQLNFSSPTNFSKFFQERTGDSPLQFRRSARGDIAVRQRPSSTG